MCIRDRVSTAVRASPFRMAMHEGDGMHTSPPTANGWPWQMSCLVDRAWGKARKNNTVYTGVCVCGKQMGAKVNLTRILHHYRFNDL